VVNGTTMNVNNYVTASSSLIVSGDSKVTLGAVTVTSGSTALVNVQADPTTGVTPSVTMNNVQPLPGSTIVVSGAGDVAIKSSSGNGTICVAGASMSGNVSSTIGVCGGDNLVMKVTPGTTLQVNGAVVGTSTAGAPTTVSVPPTANFIMTASSVDPDLGVDGNVTMGAGASANGNTTVNSGGAIVIISGDSAPHISKLVSCDGTIVLKFPQTCDALLATRSSGTIWTSDMTTVNNFKCKIIFTGLNNCQLPPLTINVGTTATGARRLLSTSTDGCEQITVVASGATYTICPLHTSAASRTSLSIMALFVTLFISLIL